ncbi:hypothetical protein HKD37_08G021565 [Glycine soja]
MNSLSYSVVGNGFNLVQGQRKAGGIKVSVLNIYSPCDLGMKRRQPSERRGFSQRECGGGVMRKFNKWIEALEVEDIPCVRRQFTWYRPNFEAKSKLGRIGRCLPKSQGGLGVRDLELFNMALPGKWRWNMLQEDDSLRNGILVELNNYSIRPSEQDRRMWVAVSENLYTVSRAYAWLYEAVVGSSEEEMLKRVWKVKFPNKVGHFIWRLVRDRLPTGRNLCLRQIPVRDIWLECYSWIGVASVVQVVPREHFLQHWYCECGRIDGQRWMVLWASVTWCIWRHRNNYIFNNKEF